MADVARIWLTYPRQMRDRLYALAEHLGQGVTPVLVLALAIGLREIESRVYAEPPPLPDDDPVSDWEARDG